MTFTQLYKTLIQERNAREFLDDPQHETGDIYEMMRNLMNKGGRVLGQGSFGRVVTHPNWDYVLKIYNDNDECYEKFVRYARKNQDNPSFPKFFGKSERYVPNLTRSFSDEYMRMVRMEKLETLDETIRHNYLFHAETYLSLINALQILKRHVDNGIDFWQSDIPARKALKSMMHFEPKLVPIVNTMEAMFKDPTFKQCNVDLHENNIMQRKTGELVIIDPFFSHYSHAPSEVQSKKARKRNDAGELMIGNLAPNKTLSQTMKDKKKAPPPKL